jgi:hypothetical protein
VEEGGGEGGGRGEEEGGTHAQCGGQSLAVKEVNLTPEPHDFALDIVWPVSSLDLGCFRAWGQMLLPFMHARYSRMWSRRRLLERRRGEEKRRKEEEEIDAKERARQEGVLLLQRVVRGHSGRNKAALRKVATSIPNPKSQITNPNHKPTTRPPFERLLPQFQAPTSPPQKKPKPHIPESQPIHFNSSHPCT